MGMTMPRPRVLPATIIAMALLLSLKSVGLLRAVTADSAVAAEAANAPPPAAAPEVAAPPPPAGAANAGAGAAGAASLPPSSPPPSSLPSSPPSSPPVPPVSEAERGLLLDLRHRRDMLDAQARAQEQRDAVMVAAERKLAARVVELNALQAKLETLEAARESHDSANWASLVHIYETMKPRDAATIFDALDMQVLLGVLDRMSTRKAAPVLAAMDPERARLATQMLAELRTRSVTPAGEAPAGTRTGATPAGTQSGDKSSPTVPDPKG
jgi:flagellar motility protein MotE (MotC chaperone)